MAARPRQGDGFGDGGEDDGALEPAWGFEDTNNNDTFGNCTVGHDWSPSTAAAEAFELERAERAAHRATTAFVRERSERAACRAASARSAPQPPASPLAVALASALPLAGTSWRSSPPGSPPPPAPNLALLGASSKVSRVGLRGAWREEVPPLPLPAAGLGLPPGLSGASPALLPAAASRSLMKRINAVNMKLAQPEDERAQEEGEPTLGVAPLEPPLPLGLLGGPWPGVFGLQDPSSFPGPFPPCFGGHPGAGLFPSAPPGASPGGLGPGPGPGLGEERRGARPSQAQALAMHAAAQASTAAACVQQAAAAQQAMGSPMWSQSGYGQATPPGVPLPGMPPYLPQHPGLPFGAGLPHNLPPGALGALGAFPLGYPVLGLPGSPFGGLGGLGSPLSGFGSVLPGLGDCPFSGFGGSAPGLTALGGLGAFAPPMQPPLPPPGMLPSDAAAAAASAAAAHQATMAALFAGSAPAGGPGAAFAGLTSSPSKGAGAPSSSAPHHRIAGMISVSELEERMLLQSQACAAPSAPAPTQSVMPPGLGGGAAAAAAAALRPDAFGRRLFAAAPVAPLMPQQQFPGAGGSLLPDFLSQSHLAGPLPSRLPPAAPPFAATLFTAPAGPPGLVGFVPEEFFFCMAAETPPPTPDPPEPEPAPTAPFTRAHRKLLLQAASAGAADGDGAHALLATSGVACFARDPRQLVGHPQMMTSSDKDFVGQIQRRQMALVLQGSAAGAAFSGALAFAVVPGGLKEAPRQAAASSSVLRALKIARLPLLLARVETLLASSAPASERSVVAAESSSGSKARPPQSKIVVVGDSGGFSALGTRLSIERAYGPLFELEQLQSRRASGLTPYAAEMEERAKILSRFAALLGSVRVDDAHAPASDCSAKATATWPPAATPLAAALRLRKGRALLRRLLPCLLGVELRALAAAMLLPPGAMRLRLLFPLAEGEALGLEVAGEAILSEDDRDESDWRLFRRALARSLSAVVLEPGDPLAPLLLPDEQSVAAVAAEALGDLLQAVEPQGGAPSLFSRICATRSGLRLLTWLLVECRLSVAGGDLDSVGRTVAEVVAEAMEVLPALLLADDASGAGSCDSDTPLREELWDALAVVAEEADKAQRSRLQEVLGPRLAADLYQAEAAVDAEAEARAAAEEEELVDGANLSL